MVVRIKNQRRLARIAMVLVVSLGGGTVTWFLFGENKKMNTSEFPQQSTEKSIPTTDHTDRLHELVSLLDTKLQAPLVPIAKPKNNSFAKPPLPKVNWPPLTLDCIVFSESAQVATFSSDRKSFVCEQGDEFLNLKVKRIKATEVELWNSGEAKVFRILNSEK